MAQADQKEMVALFRRELELCKVRKGETVAVLSAGEAMNDYRKAFLAATRVLGAKAVDVHLKGADESADDRLKNFGKNQLADNPAALEKCKTADMVVDLFVASFSPEGDAIQNAGARMLLVGETFDVLRRLAPSPDLQRRTEASLARLAKAKKFRFTNAFGTDVTYKFGGDFKPLMEYGVVDRPGRWDHWPAGLVANCAKTAEGVVVMAPGDIMYPAMAFVEKPLEFHIEGGQVRKVKGGKEADRLRRWMDSYKDPRAYAVSHIGWGTHTDAHWAVGGIGMDGRSYYGNVLFSLGPNLEFGGKNDTTCHLDLPMRNCTAWLDAEKIIENGRILPDDIRAEGH